MEQVLPIHCLTFGLLDCVINAMHIYCNLCMMGSHVETPTIQALQETYASSYMGVASHMPPLQFCSLSLFPPTHKLSFPFLPVDKFLNPIHLKTIINP